MSESTRCKRCKYWSSMLVEARGSTIYAVCLNQHRKPQSEFVPSWHSCEKFADGDPVDIEYAYRRGNDD